MKPMINMTTPIRVRYKPIIPAKIRFMWTAYGLYMYLSRISDAIITSIVIILSALFHMECQDCGVHSYLIKSNSSAKALCQCCLVGERDKALCEWMRDNKPDKTIKGVK